jgi:hypothetical protein
VQWILDDWSRTLRLLALTGGLAVCVAGIVLVIQLSADHWTRVVLHGSVILFGGGATVIGLLRTLGRFAPRGAGPPDDRTPAETSLDMGAVAQVLDPSGDPSSEALHARYS